MGNDQKLLAWWSVASSAMRKTQENVGRNRRSSVAFRCELTTKRCANHLRHCTRTAYTVQSNIVCNHIAVRCMISLFLLHFVMQMHKRLSMNAAVIIIFAFNNMSFFFFQSRVSHLHQWKIVKQFSTESKSVCHWINECTHINCVQRKESTFLTSATQSIRIRTNTTTKIPFFRALNLVHPNLTKIYENDHHQLYSISFQC